MKVLKFAAALAASSLFALAPAMADSIDPNNPTVTNERVDKAGQPDIMARFGACKEFKGYIPENATEQQMGNFRVLCGEFMSSTAGELSIPDNATEQNLDKATSTN